MVRTCNAADQMPIQNLTNNTNSWEKEKQDVSSTSNSWNVTVFIEAVKDVVPSMNWMEVIAKLDHPGFIISDAEGLRVILHAYRVGQQGTFPIDLIYRNWKNTEGQLSFIEQSLRHPEILCFGDYPCHTVVTDILKAPPEEGNKHIANWQSLNLVETLLRLGECGHYDRVFALFGYPAKICPDVLLLSLLQTNPTWHTLRNELVAMIMPIFLGNHPNSSSVLHYAWHGQGQSASIRQLILHCMANWYMQGDPFDQTRLSRILDVSQDLKALSLLLNTGPFPFVIDLAALAARRGYLKLDKWMNDKMKENKDEFIRACISFLDKRAPSLIISQGNGRDLPKSAVLPTDTITTMLAVLQNQIGSTDEENTKTIKLMIANHAPMHTKKSSEPANISKPTESKVSTINQQTSSNPQPHPTVSDLSAVWSGADNTFTKSIEDEANAYFQKLYNRPPESTISINEMLSLLKRFKDSNVKKENDIFHCMLRNLMEEYKYFPQYPDLELRTTAVLFGGIIEQGLVTYMDLGVALRYVLEALKKPPTSKMHNFGITALDRFKNRLKDYPKYCDHLALIPHFHEFPSSLVAYVEYGIQSQEPPAPPTGSDDSEQNSQVTAQALSVAPDSGTKSVISTVMKPPVEQTLSIAGATNISTLLAAIDVPFEQPPNATQDKFHFIFNNLSNSNIKFKVNLILLLIIVLLLFVLYERMDNNSIKFSNHANLICTTVKPTNVLIATWESNYY